MPYDEGWVSKIDQFTKRYLWFISFENIFVSEVFSDLIMRIVLEKLFWGAHTYQMVSKNIIYIWYSFWAKVLAIPYRKLAQVGFKPTNSCLLCIRSNHWAIWLNDEAQVIAVINVIYTLFIYVIYMIYLYVLHCIVLYIYIYIYIYIYCIVLYCIICI